MTLRFLRTVTATLRVSFLYEKIRPQREGARAKAQRGRDEDRDRERQQDNETQRWARPSKKKRQRVISTHHKEFK